MTAKVMTLAIRRRGKLDTLTSPHTEYLNILIIYRMDDIGLTCPSVQQDV